MYKYLEISKKIEEKIFSVYSAKERFATEEQLCKQYRVNRATVHRALEDLEKKGLLIRRGRAGNFVTDYINTGFDKRLLVVAMPLKGHLWEKLYLELSCRATETDRFLMAIDTGAMAKKEPGAEKEFFKQLERALSFRPRNLILSSEMNIATFLEKLGKSRRKFRNLIWLDHNSDIFNVDDIYAGQVSTDMHKTWQLLTEEALKVGYKDFILFVSVLKDYWDIAEPQICKVIEKSKRANGTFSKFSQKNLQESLSSIINLAKSSKSLAVLCVNDYGAHLVTGALRMSGIQIPEQVGIYGIFNTPWAKQDNLTTVDFNLELWSHKVMECIERLEKGAKKRKILIPPVFVQRLSTRIGR
ncbi:MAG: GntR family transcriptional regulator [Verrucomicrobiota bacterium]|nr:GntR family transcriptional regulator [Verrucomicrobiota bacterium]